METQLTEAELAILKDRHFMPLKASTLQKLEQSLLLLRNQIRAELKHTQFPFPFELDQQQGKISKGENYHTYAYRVLDFPRAFQGENIFTYRTLILWGHHISFNLILSGESRQAFHENLQAHIPQLPPNFFLSQQKTAWKWEWDEQDYLTLPHSSEQIQAHIKHHPFIKLSYFMPLEQYQRIPKQGLAVWRVFAEMLFGLG